jgi:hypothetical protein
MEPERVFTDLDLMNHRRQVWVHSRVQQQRLQSRIPIPENHPAAGNNLRRCVSALRMQTPTTASMKSHTATLSVHERNAVTCLSPWPHPSFILSHTSRIISMRWSAMSHTPPSRPHPGILLNDLSKL